MVLVARHIFCSVKRAPIDLWLILETKIVKLFCLKQSPHCHSHFPIPALSCCSYFQTSLLSVTENIFKGLVQIIYIWLRSTGCWGLVGFGFCLAHLWIGKHITRAGTGRKKIWRQSKMPLRMVLSAFAGRNMQRKGVLPFGKNHLTTLSVKTTTRRMLSFVPISAANQRILTPPGN